MKNKRGITLIALIITIIVLLILAGVSISIVVGDNGVLNNARKASTRTEFEGIKQDIQMEKSAYIAQQYDITEPEPDTPNYSEFIPEKYKDILEVSSNGTLIYVGNENDDIANIARESDILIGKDALKDELMKNVDKLWKLAQQYKQENPTTVDSETELVLQYIRRNKYADEIWKLFSGEINEGFKNYVQNNNSDLANYNFNNAKVTGSDTDFVHMIASLNALVYTSILLPKEYAGWAGDLVTLMGEVVQYDSTTERGDLLAYAKGKLARKGVASTFGYEDMVADIDAVNLYEIYKNSEDKDFANIMFNYYYFNPNSFKDNKINFVNSFNLGNTTLKDYVINNFNNLINSVAISKILKRNFGESVTQKYQSNSQKYNEVVAQAFQDYFEE